MKVVAIIGLLFCFYCLRQVLSRRQLYGGVQLGCWTVFLIVGFGLCLWLLGVLRFLKHQ